jgi:SlyX protein
MTNITSRIDELEIRMVHQDQTIADLNEVITAQWKKIEALERHLLRLGEELQKVDVRSSEQEAPPPHY